MFNLSVHFDQLELICRNSRAQAFFLRPPQFFFFLGGVESPLMDAGVYLKARPNDLYTEEEQHYY